MDPYFHYNVVPKPAGGYTTRIVLQDDLLTPELTASTAAALAARGVPLTEAQITACGEELAKVQIAALSRGRVVRRAFNLFTYEPTCGGTHETPDFTASPENMNPQVRGRLAPAGADLFEGPMQFHRENVLGEKVPTVSRIFNAATGNLDELTLGGAFRISGPEDFGAEPLPAQTTLGVFVQRTGGPLVRIVGYSRWTESEIYGAWPAAIAGSGDVTLRVVVRYPRNQTDSVFIYGTPLTVV